MKNYFEGWYFKQQNKDMSIAFIVSYHKTIDEEYGLLQIITNHKTSSIKFTKSKMAISKNPLVVLLGNNRFSEDGIYVDICTDEIKVKGSIRFKNISPLMYDIMGPLKYLPNMECIHTVISTQHKVSGTLEIDGEKVTFSKDKGYIEGDKGTSFPKNYMWTQCFGDGVIPISLMLSAATIPYGGINFIGTTCFVNICGKEYRLATYLGAKVTISGRKKITITQGHYSITAILLEEKSKELKAPVQGEMNRLIKESICCKARYIFKRDGRAIFDFVSDTASFEYEF